MIRARQNYPSFALALSQPPSPQTPLVSPHHRSPRRAAPTTHSTTRSPSRAPAHQKPAAQDFMKTVDYRFSEYQARPAKRPRSATSLSAVDAPPLSSPPNPARPNGRSRARTSSPVRPVPAHLHARAGAPTGHPRPASVGDTSDTKTATKKAGVLGVVLDLTLSWTKKRKPMKERPEFVRV